MNTTTDPNKSSILDQLRRVLHEGIDYAASALHLLQAQATSLVLSSAAFLLLVFFGVLTSITSFVLLSVALGIWLTHLTGHAGWALLIIGGFYGIVTVILGGIAGRWLSRLNS